jgi:ligand-binding sensor domain-containing protein/serine phosphatase RsbU (regulator of sigma subunit)
MVRRALIVVLVAGRAFAQPAALPTPAATPGSTAAPAKETFRIAEPLDFDRLSTADGLPQANVQAMVQDSYGFMWLGTQDGLARYDGIKMRTFRPVENDASSISTGYITALALDAAGKVWIGTDNKGVDVYDPNTDKFTRYAQGAGAKGLSADGVNAIIRDAKDRIWLAMSDKGLDLFDSTAAGFTPKADGALATTITALDDDKAGNLWLGTVEDGVVRWNPDDNSTVKYQSVTKSQVNSILAASTGKVWIGTEGDGLFVLEPATKKLVPYHHDPTDPLSLSDDHVSALYEDRDGNIWVGTHNGLNRIDHAGHIAQYNHEENNPSTIVYPWITSIYQDKGGVIWAGGKGVGLSKFSPLRPKFGHYRMRSYTANSFFEDRDGSLWVGTYHGGLYHYEWDNDRVTVYHTLGVPGSESSVQLDSAWISSVRRDKRGTLWIATLELGLISFEPETEAYRQFRAEPDNPKGLPQDGIWDIWEDDKGVMWIASWGGGLVTMDPRTQTFTSITSADGVGLSSDYLYKLYPDPKDTKLLWIGTAKGGVVRYDMVAKTATAFRHKGDDPNSLTSDDVLSIYREPGGTLWVGTYGGGLNHLDPGTGKAEHFTTGNSPLPSDQILGVLADDAGNLWLSTNGGGLVNLDTKSKQFFVYDSTDGVQDNEFGQGAYMHSKSGKLYFGGVGGYNAFLPKDITRDAYVPPVVLTGLKVFNQEAKLDRPIWTLPPLEVSYSDSFELQFAALSFASPKKNRYAYKLEGFDSKFIETDRPFATYTKLDGGKYTLRVRAVNEHGVGEEKGIELRIRVTPPWWRTWPAFAAYVLILAGVVFMIFRLQRQKLRRLERESRLAVVERDLELTGAVQSGFLPDYNEFSGQRVNLFGYYRAADACSGDWWWHEALQDGRHVILVGDVTGHGPGPAMVTAAVATAFRVIAGSGPIDVPQALELLNQVVLHVAKGKYHMTMAALEINELTGEWTLHNAGAPPILSLNSSGKHKVHFSPGTPLGTESGFEVGRLDGRLEPGERFMIYTDGIPEIALPNGNVLGIRRFAQMYERTRQQPLTDAAAMLAQLAEQTQSGTPQADDWTFTLVEWR